MIHREISEISEDGQQLFWSFSLISLISL